MTPHLIAACDFVIRERTQRHDADGQTVPEWGLLPAGHLEDNPEWRHWFAVNAHAYAGMRAIAEVLASVEHPEAARLTREAAAYREAIRRAARRAMVNNVGSELYPDVRAFAEHPVTELGHGVGPFYKSPDECKALIWLRHFLLHEEDEALHLAMGAPRTWFAPGQTFGVRDMATFFGPVTYCVRSGPAEITVAITLSDARPPRTLFVHLRLPKGQTMQAVRVNGQRHTDFDPAEQVIRISSPKRRLRVVAQYAQRDMEIVESPLVG